MPLETALLLLIEVAVVDGEDGKYVVSPGSGGKPFALVLPRGVTDCRSPSMNTHEAPLQCHGWNLPLVND